MSMLSIDRDGLHSLPKEGISVVLIFFVCICVVSQMLGAPVTLIDLFTSETPAESLSEDFSIPPITPKPGAPSRFSFHVAFEPSFHIPIFSTSVFHPPQL